MRWILLLLSMLLVSCNYYQNIDYNDIERRHFIKWKEVFNTAENGYFYFFSYSCPSCANIKQEILKFLMAQDNYFLIVKSEDIQYGEEIDLKGVSNIDDFYIIGFPTLMTLTNNQVDLMLAGRTQILEHIKNSSI